MTLRPGVARLLHEAQAASLRLAIATTTSPANVSALLRSTLGPGGAGLFECIAAGDMVAKKKPAPDVYRLVLDRLRVLPDHCVAFEDTPNGLVAARALAEDGADRSAGAELDSAGRELWRALKPPAPRVGAPSAPAPPAARFGRRPRGSPSPSRRHRNESGCGR